MAHEPLIWDKLYLIARDDLPPGLVVSQSAHAARMLADLHEKEERRWHETSNTLVCCVSVCPESDADMAERHGALVARFIDADVGPSVLAVAILGAPRKLARRLRLAFKDRVLVRKEKSCCKEVLRRQMLGE